MGRANLGSKRERRPGVWEIAVGAGYCDDGSRRRAYSTVYGTEREADYEILRLSRELGLSPSFANINTLGDYWPDFYSRCHAKGLTKAALMDYADTWRLHVEPVLGDTPLADVTYAVVQRLVLTKTHATGMHTAKLIRRMLTCAMDDGLIDSNPLLGRRLDYRVKATRDPFERPPVMWGIPEVLEAANRLRDCPMEPLWLALVGGGLRVSEGLGLWWEDLDFSHVIHQNGECGLLAQALVWKSWTRKDGWKSTKTPSSVRTVPIPDPFASRLAELALEGPRVSVFQRGFDRVGLMWRHLFVKPKKAMSDDGYMGVLVGMPYLPLKDMRSVHETLMQDTGTLDTLNARLHGRTNVQVGYGHYLKPQAPAFEAAAESLYTAFSSARYHPPLTDK